MKTPVSALNVGSPARAGIGPVAVGHALALVGFPRASGDRPCKPTAKMVIPQVPPRERG